MIHKFYLPTTNFIKNVMNASPAIHYVFTLFTYNEVSVILFALTLQEIFGLYSPVLESINLVES